MTAILYEDAAMLAVDKPAGVLAVRGREGAAEPSLLDELARERNEKLFIVHRLDRNTSGILLFARTAQAHRALNLAFEEGRVEKRYLALVKGVPEQSELRVEVPLIAARRGKSRPAKAGELGKEALTIFKVLERFNGFALLEAVPKTGRTHQIRVHLRYAGFPLAVDSQYANVDRLLRGDLGLAPAEEPVLERTPLHAGELVVPHPETGRPLALHSPLPKDLEAALAVLRAAAVDLKKSR